jgi:hypothetical protein
MNTEIIDHCQKTAQGNQIKLTHCLQSSSCKDGPYFYRSDYDIGLAAKIERLDSDIKIDSESFDLIRMTRHGSTSIFLGHWNNGVL